MLERLGSPLLIDNGTEVAGPAAIVRAVDHGLGDLLGGLACGRIAAVLLPQQRKHRREHPTELQPDGESRAYGRHVEEAGGALRGVDGALGGVGGERGRAAFPGKHRATAAM
nr:hypothetical protein [Deltaproteobacteria bacterium]